jgi:hypothetical protein
LAFIVENVSSIAPADKCTFSKALGVTPVGVAASDLAHCRRDRLYWCGPNSAFASLKEKLTDVKWLTIPGGPGLVSRWIRPGSVWTESQHVSGRLPTLVRRLPKPAPPREPRGLERCDKAALQRYTQDRHAYPPYHYLAQLCVRRPGGLLEPPDAEERELLMDFPLRHTITLAPTSWRKEAKHKLEVQRCELLGNSFQCGVLAWLLGHWAVKAHLLEQVPSVEQMRDQAPGHRRMPTNSANSPHRPWNLQPSRSSHVSPMDSSASDLVLELMSVADLRGFDVRLDSGHLLGPRAWPRRPINTELWVWRSVLRHTWRLAEPITALEARAALQAFKWRCRKVDNHHNRFLHLVDNQSVLGVLSKCRSSSYVLHAIAAKYACLALASMCVPFHAYCETDRNPADAGSGQQPEDAPT